MRFEESARRVRKRRRRLRTAVKGHADSIAKKYIVPNEGTLDLALMFVPSETVYYEMLMTLDSKGEASGLVLPRQKYYRRLAEYALRASLRDSSGFAGNANRGKCQADFRGALRDSEEHVDFYGCV